MNITRIDPPYVVKIESTEGCTLACAFCGIQTIRENGADRATMTNGKASGPFKFLTPEIVDKIGADMARHGWTSRIEFTLHGEPTANMRLPEFIRILRRHLPKNSIMVTSNGSGLRADPETRITALFDAGLNSLFLDDYRHSVFLDKIKPWLLYCAYPVYHYPEEKITLHQANKDQRIVVIHDISENTSGTHQLTNQGGHSGGPATVLMKRCGKPFRELAIRHDGNVAICCDDWTGTYKVGSILDTDIDELWHSDRFEAARRLLYAADRRFGICAGCDVKTFRNGLLPDRMGKLSMPAPDDEARKVTREAVSGASFTPRVRKSISPVTSGEETVSDLL